MRTVLSTKDKKKLAWIVNCNEICVITFADNRSEAKWNAIYSFREAGYLANYFPSINAKRYPKGDNFDYLKYPKRHCFSEDFF